MKEIKIAIVLFAIILLITTLSSTFCILAECGDNDRNSDNMSGVRADDNAPAYIYLDISNNEREIKPSETARYSIIVRNLGDADIYYYPPLADSFNLPPDWVISLTPADELFIPADRFGYLKVNLTAAADATANTKIEIVVEGTTSIPEAKIIPLELITTVTQVYDIAFTTTNKLTLASPIIPTNFDITIQNNGNGNDWISLEITDIPNGLTLSLEVQELIIVPDSTEKITITMYPSSVLTAGEYDLNISLFRVQDLIKSWVSSHKLVVEVVYYPDLSISTGDIELSKYPPMNGEDILINVTVHNIGDSDAAGIKVKIYPITRSGSHLEDIDAIDITSIGLDNSTTISVPWRATPPAVNKLLVIIDPDDTIGELDKDNNRAEFNIYIIPPEIDRHEENPDVGEFTANQLYAVAIVAILAGITVSIGASFIATEYGKYGLIKLILPFYTRVKREEVLDHEVRELVYDYVKTHPGEHFRAILTKLGLTNGTLVHHLHTLERQNFIKSERDGPFKRFYPTGRQLTEDVLEINGIQKKILDAVTTNPGMTQKDLALQLQTSPPTINYHVKALSGVRLLNIKREGKNTRCFPGQSLNGWFQSGKVS